MKTKLIAELCQNHLGDRELLGRLVGAAADAGADYVKIQSIFSEDLARRPRFDEGEIGPDGAIKTIKRPYAAEKERLAKLDLTFDDHVWFIEKCKQAGVLPLTTIFARRRVPEIAALPWPEKTIKVASYDCASYPFLSELADYFDHLIVSTGATYDEEILKAVKTVKAKGKKITLLHAVTSYPNALDNCHLSRMEYLAQFTDQVGWSDHTKVADDGIVAASAAAMLGADFIERHFTILETDKTKDGPVSVTPELLKELSDFRELSQKAQMETLDERFPRWRQALGRPNRQMTREELLNRDYYRGRFASFIDDEWIYNWEAKKL